MVSFLTVIYFFNLRSAQFSFNFNIVTYSFKWKAYIHVCFSVKRVRLFFQREIIESSELTV